MRRLPGSRDASALIAAWLAALAAAVVLTLLAAANDTLPGDEDLLTWLQDQPVPGQRLSDAVRALTTTQVAVPIGIVAAVAALIARRWWLGAAAVAAILALPFVQAGLKDLVDRPRPAPPLAGIRASITSPSFPSGHIMSGTLAWGLVALVAWALPLPRWAQWAATAVALAVILLNAPANVWTGVHWPSDIVGGYLWALVLLLPVWWLAGRVKSNG